MSLLCSWGGDNFPVWFGNHKAKGSQATQLSSSAAFPWCFWGTLEPLFESGVSGSPGRTQPDGCREHPALQEDRAGGMEKPGGVEVIRRVLEHRTQEGPGAQTPSHGCLGAFDHGVSHASHSAGSQGTLAAGLRCVRVGAIPTPCTPQAVQRAGAAPAPDDA